jgi:glutamate decarboxylase
VLHRTIKDSENVTVQATNSPEEELPKFRLPQGQSSASVAYQLTEDELMLDGNERQNLATFCGTWYEPEVIKIMSDAVGKNMIDKDEYRHSAELEERCVHMIANLWNSAQADSTMGTSTTGSSEAAMLGGLAMKWRWRSANESKVAKVPNLVTGPVQVCWHKFARYFDVEIREVPLRSGRYVSDPEEIVSLCDQNTIGVVNTLGTTFTGHYENIEELHRALDDLQEKTGIDVPIHVDAASGGFVAPFLDPGVRWDFRLRRVVSINSSGHKYGLAPLGVGWVIWRDESHLPEDLVFRVNYLGGEMPTFALNFSRPGGQVAAQYYNFIRLGFEGYQRVMSNLRNCAAFIGDEIRSIDRFEIVSDGRSGLPLVTWTSRKGEVDLYRLSNQLRSFGWQVPTYTLPSNLESTVVQRVVVRQGFTLELARQFVSDLQQALKYLDANPMAPTANSHRKGGFSH